MRAPGSAPQLPAAELRAVDQTIAELRAPNLDNLRAEALIRLANDIDKLDHERREELYLLLLEKGKIDSHTIKEIENCRNKEAKNELLAQAVEKALKKTATTLQALRIADKNNAHLSSLAHPTNTELESAPTPMSTSHDGGRYEYSAQREGLDFGDYDKKEIKLMAEAIEMIAESERHKIEEKKKKEEEDDRAEHREKLEKSIQSICKDFPELKEALEGIINLPDTPFQRYISITDIQTLKEKTPEKTIAPKKD